MLRRLAYLLVVLAFLILMSLPILAFVLAARGELMFGSDQGSNIRLFMVNATEAEGIGIQRVRKAGPENDCYQGSVRYLLWEGQGKELAADYCMCFDAQDGYAVVPGRCNSQ